MTNAWNSFEVIPPKNEFFSVYGEDGDGNGYMALFEYEDGYLMTDCLTAYWRKEGILPLLWRRRSWPRKSLIAKAYNLPVPSWGGAMVPEAPQDTSKVRNDYPWFAGLSKEEQEARLEEYNHVPPHNS